MTEELVPEEQAASNASAFKKLQSILPSVSSRSNLMTSPLLNPLRKVFGIQ
ncbi:hypothetical protein IC582_008636 [Cucumis melo]